MRQPRVSSSRWLNSEHVSLFDTENNHILLTKQRQRIYRQTNSKQADKQTHKAEA